MTLIPNIQNENKQKKLPPASKIVGNDGLLPLFQEFYTGFNTV